LKDKTYLLSFNKTWFGAKFKMKNTSAISDIEYHLDKNQIDAIADYFKHKFIYLPKGKTKNTYLKCYYLTYILYYTGRRISEIIGAKPFIRLQGLKIEDINFDEKRIKFYIAKKNSVRKYKKQIQGENIMLKRIKDSELAELKYSKSPYFVYYPVTNKVLDLLQKAIKYFKIKEGKRIIKLSRSCYDARLKEASKVIGISVKGTKKVRKLEGREYIKDSNGMIKIVANSPLYKYNYSYSMGKRQIGAHILRHSFAIHFIEKNKDDPLVLQKVQKLLEHSSINITNAYLSATNENLRSGLEKL
jgi:integrase